MNQWYQYIFYEQAETIRDLDRKTADLILEAESIDINTATMLECKQAVVRWQYVGEGEDWKWMVNTDELGVAVDVARLKA